MSIKVSKGMVPKFGRLTMPKGTFLSNPATAHDGAFGAIGGPRPGGPTSPVDSMNLVEVVRALLAVPQPGQVAPQIPGVSPVFSGGAGTPTVNAYGRGPRPGGPNAPASSMGFLNVVRGVLGEQLQNEPQFQTQGVEFSQVKPSQPTKVFQSPSHSLVGNNIAATPGAITQKQLQAMFGNMSAQEIAATMTQKGYDRTYQMGVGEVWVKTRESTPTQQLSNTNNGQRVADNPYAIGATLAPGEHVVTAGYVNEAGSVMGKGIGVTGGTPYTDKTGKTVSQYALTYGGQGDRWKFKISKDSEGNWVRTYYKTFSKARSRSALKKKQGRKEDAYREQQASYEEKRKRQEQEAASYADSQLRNDNIPTQPGYDQQLVTFRANFG